MKPRCSKVRSHQKMAIGTQLLSAGVYFLTITTINFSPDTKGDDSEKLEPFKLR